MVVPKSTRIVLLSGLALLTVVLALSVWVVNRNASDGASNTPSQNGSNQAVKDSQLEPVFLYFPIKHIDAKNQDGYTRSFPFYKVLRYDPASKELLTLFDEYGSTQSYLYNFYVLGENQLLVAYEHFISTLNLTTKEETKIASYTRGEGSGTVAVNKDKTKIVYTDKVDSSVKDSGEVVVRSLEDGAEKRILFKNAGLDGLGSFWFVPMSFSPDEKYVYFSVAAGEVATDVRRMNLETGEFEVMPFRNIGSYFLPNSDIFAYAPINSGVDLCNDFAGIGASEIRIYEADKVIFDDSTEKHVFSSVIISQDGASALYYTTPALSEWSGSYEDKQPVCNDYAKQRKYYHANLTNQSVSQVNNPLVQLGEMIPGLTDFSFGYYSDGSGPHYSVKINGEEVVPKPTIGDITIMTNGWRSDLSLSYFFLDDPS